MAIANLPTFYDMDYVDKDGHLTSPAQLYNDQLWQSLNDMANQFNLGLQLPQKTTTQITALAMTAVDGTMWYNTTTNKAQVMVSGTVRDIDTTP